LTTCRSTSDAAFVAGFRAWLQLGYCVRKGEKAIRILAPMPLKRGDDDETEDVRILFRAASVFDVSQVSPIEGAEPCPLEPPCEPLTGDSHEHLLLPLVAFATTLGFTTSFEPVAGSAGGFCDPRAKRLVVDAAAPANARVRTLVHEIAHALGVDYKTYSARAGRGDRRQRHFLPWSPLFAAQGLGSTSVTGVTDVLSSPALGHVTEVPRGQAGRSVRVPTQTIVWRRSDSAERRHGRFVSLRKRNSRDGAAPLLLCARAARAAAP
jgi:hypothetical protein